MTRQARLASGRTPLDLFFVYDEVHDAMRDARRLVPFGDGTIPVLSPEHLVLMQGDLQSRERTGSTSPRSSS